MLQVGDNSWSARHWVLGWRQLPGQLYARTGHRRPHQGSPTAANKPRPRPGYPAGASVAWGPRSVTWSAAHALAGALLATTSQGAVIWTLPVIHG